MTSPDPVSIVPTILATAVESILSPQVAEPSKRTPVHIVYVREMSTFVDTISKSLGEISTESVYAPLSKARLLNSSRVISIADL